MPEEPTMANKSHLVKCDLCVSGEALTYYLYWCESWGKTQPLDERDGERDFYLMAPF